MDATFMSTTRNIGSETELDSKKKIGFGRGDTKN